MRPKPPKHLRLPLHLDFRLHQQPRHHLNHTKPRQVLPRIAITPAAQAQYHTIPTVHLSLLVVSLIRHPALQQESTSRPWCLDLNSGRRRLNTSRPALPKRQSILYTFGDISQRFPHDTKPQYILFALNTYPPFPDIPLLTLEKLNPTP